MSWFGWTVTAAAVAAAEVGLWRHDWTLIVVGALTAAIWPMIRKGVEDV
jgi:hypothetical protein